METVVISMLVCMILGISYVYFGKEQESKREQEIERGKLVRDFFRQEIMSIKKLELAGAGNDGNSDFEFIQAVKKIDVPDDIRVRIYD